MSAWAIPLSPWWARDRKAVAREKRRASHGPWLARSRSTSSHWARGPEYAVAWEEALRRLPSLARLDNAGEFGRAVLRSMLNRAMFMRWSRNPRARARLRPTRGRAGVLGDGVPRGLHPPLHAEEPSNKRYGLSLLRSAQIAEELAKSRGDIDEATRLHGERCSTAMLFRDADPLDARFRPEECESEISFLPAMGKFDDGIFTRETP